MNESYWLDQYMDWSGHCSNPALTWTPSQEWRIGVQTHILLEATLQLVIGSPLPFFQYPLTQVMEFCTHKWLLNVCKFVTSIHATFHFKRAWRLDLQCTNDVSLMDSFMMHVPHLPPNTLKRLNACRIFLQVITLADIIDGGGNHILPGSL